MAIMTWWLCSTGAQVPEISESPIWAPLLLVEASVKMVVSVWNMRIVIPVVRFPVTAVAMFEGPTGQTSESKQTGQTHGVKMPL